MKIEHHQGCTGASFTVDGESIYDMGDDQCRDLLDKILDHMTKSGTANFPFVIKEILDCVGTESRESADEPCECCGDYWVSETWEITVD